MNWTQQKNVWALTTVLVLMVASPATAQEFAAGPESKQQAPTVGIGAKMPVQLSWIAPNSTGLGGLRSPSPTGTLVIPILFGEDLRLEPHVALGASSWSSDNRSSEGSGLQTRSESWGVGVGAALHHLWSPFEATQGYAGVQAGLSYGQSSTEREDANGESTDTESRAYALHAGPVLGGEYQPTETFGFGVEAGVSLSYSAHSGYGGLGGLGGLLDNDISEVDLRSHTSLFARVYLW